MPEASDGKISAEHPFCGMLERDRVAFRAEAWTSVSWCGEGRSPRWGTARGSAEAYCHNSVKKLRLFCVSIRASQTPRRRFRRSTCLGVPAKFLCHAAGAWVEDPSAYSPYFPEKTGDSGKFSSALPVCTPWPAGKICSGVERLQSPPPPLAGLLTHSRVRPDFFVLQSSRIRAG